jgi:hypothetical protein
LLTWHPRGGGTLLSVYLIYSLPPLLLSRVSLLRRPPPTPTGGLLSLSLSVPPSPRPRVRHAAEPRARPAEARVAELARETGGGPRAGASPRGQGLREGEVEPSAEELPKIFSHIHGHPQLASFHPSPRRAPRTESSPPSPPHALEFENGGQNPSAAKL